MLQLLEESTASRLGMALRVTWPNASLCKEENRTQGVGPSKKGDRAGSSELQCLDVKQGKFCLSEGDTRLST